MRCQDARRLHALRPGHRHPLCQHELHAVRRKGAPGNDPLDSPPGRPPDPDSVSLKWVLRLKRRYLRPGTDRLYCGGPVDWSVAGAGEEDVFITH